MIKENDKDLEIIDFDLLNDNTIVVYYGKNGKQYGDDWNDVPYDCNGGEVYEEFIQERKIYVVNPDVFVLSEYADKFKFLDNPNCNVSKNDFIERKVPCFELTNTNYNHDKLRIDFYFGDTKEKLEKEINIILNFEKDVFQVVK